MARFIKGISVTLVVKEESGKDPFGHPILTETEKVIENVLVAPVSSEDVEKTLNLTGRKAVYQLAIPKGDENKWEGQEVKFFGRRWRVIGIPAEGIEELMPLDWNKKVQVEVYE